MNAVTNDGDSSGHGRTTRWAEDWYLFGDKSCVRESRSSFGSVARVGTGLIKHLLRHDAANSPYAHRRRLARGYVAALDRSQR
jgi:hypothetical protein